MNRYMLLAIIIGALTGAWAVFAGSMPLAFSSGYAMAMATAMCINNRRNR